MKNKELREQACYRCNKRAGEPKDKQLRCCFICKPVVVKELTHKERTSHRPGLSMLKNQWRHYHNEYLIRDDVSRYFRLTIDALKRMPVGRVIKEATRLAHTGNLLINLLKEKKH